MTPGPKNILLTGGTGFLGRVLLRSLAERGDQIHLLVRKNSRRAFRTWLAEYRKAQPDAAGRIRVLTGDVAGPGIFEEEGARDRVLSEIDTVIHCAAATHAAVDRRLAYDTNVTGTRAMLDLARAIKGLQRFVHLSCSCVAGDHRGPFREEDLLVGQHFASRYGETKMVAERKVRAAMAELPIMIVRPSSLVGNSKTGEVEKVEGLYHLVLLALRLSGLPRPLRWLPPPPGGDSLRIDVVPVDYVRDAILALMDRADTVGHCYQLSDQFALTVGEWFALLAKELDLHRMPGALPSGLLGRAWRAPAVKPLRDLIDQGADLPPEVVENLASAATFDSTQAERILRPLGIAPPHVPDWAGRMIEHTRAVLR